MIYLFGSERVNRYENIYLLLFISFLDVKIPFYLWTDPVGDAARPRLTERYLHHVQNEDLLAMQETWYFDSYNVTNIYRIINYLATKFKTYRKWKQ